MGQTGPSIPLNALELRLVWYDSLFPAQCHPVGAHMGMRLGAHTTADGAVAARGSPSMVCHAGNGSWSSPGDGGGGSPCSCPSCEVCLHTLETHWSSPLDRILMARGGPSDHPVGGGVSAT